MDIIDRAGENVAREGKMVGMRLLCEVGGFCVVEEEKMNSRRDENAEK